MATPTMPIVEAQRFMGENNIWLGRRGTGHEDYGQPIKSLAERATERVEKILAEHRPEPLPDDVVQAIRSIVRRAEEQFGGTE